MARIPLSPIPPIYTEEVEPGIFAIRFEPGAAEALGIEADVRLFAGPGGKPAADAYVGVLLRRLAEVQR